MPETTEDVRDFIDGKKLMLSFLRKKAASTLLFEELLASNTRLHSLAESDKEHSRFYLGMSSAIEDYLNRQGVSHNNVCHGISDSRST